MEIMFSVVAIVLIGGIITNYWLLIETRGLRQEVKGMRQEARQAQTPPVWREGRHDG